MNRPLAALLAPLATLAALGAPLWAEDRALVIGIDDYTRLSSPVVLTQAVADARRFAGFLTERAGFAPGQVTLLTEDKAGSDAILGAVVDELLGRTTDGDRIVFYFAGLGTATPATSGEVVPALVAADGDTDLGLIPADLLDDLFDLAPGRQVTLVLDTGFGGTAGTPGAAIRNLESASGAPADYAAFGAGPDRDLWAAAAPGQPAWESASGGVMTGLILEGMAGLADADHDAIVTAGELAGHLTARAAGFCAAEPACAATGLTPVTTAGDDRVPFIPADLLPRPGDTTPADAGALDHDQILALLDEMFGQAGGAVLTLGIDAAQPMEVGTRVGFSLSATQTGALVLLDIDTEGRLTQLFPSPLAPDEGDAIAAGTVVQLPQGVSANGLPLRVTAVGPPGRGILLALFSPRGSAELAQVLPPDLRAGALPDAGQALFRIGQDLLRRDADPATSLSWSAAWLTYEITD